MVIPHREVIETLNRGMMRLLLALTIHIEEERVILMQELWMQVLNPILAMIESLKTSLAKSSKTMEIDKISQIE